MKKSTLSLANCLQIPVDTKALLWDMDGVLIDSLGLDMQIVNDLLQKYFSADVMLSRSYIRSIFAYDVPTFWQYILEKVEQDFFKKEVFKKKPQILEEYEAARQTYPFHLNPGITEILSAAKKKGLLQAVVSNNPTAQVKEILRNVGILEIFDLIVGNDLSREQEKLRKKPAPDTFLFAVKQLNIPPQQCVVIEDSLIGITAGKEAGCFTIGVATGSSTPEEMRQNSPPPDAIYSSFS